MEETRKRSLEVMEKVEHKSEEILNHSNLFKTDIDHEFKNSIKDMADKYILMIQEHSKKFTNDYENILTSVKDQSITQSKQALANIEFDVKKQLDDSREHLKTEMLKSLDKAKLEIEEYRKKELTKVDEEIDKLVVEMAKDLLRINLTPKDHKKLVIQALDKAKQQGAFFL